MNYAERIVAVNKRVNDYTNGINIVNFLKIFALDINLAENAVNRFYTRGDLRMCHNRRDFCIYL